MRESLISKLMLKQLFLLWKSRVTKLKSDFEKAKAAAAAAAVAQATAPAETATATPAKV